MFAEEVDAEFLTCLGEAEETIEGEDVGEDAAALVEMGHSEELEGRFLASWGEGAVLGGGVVVVHARMLLVKGFVEDTASDTAG